MSTATVTEPRRHPQPIVGKRVELARYTISSGARVLYGQRINGSVRFLVARPVVFTVPSRGSDDSRCRARKALPEAAPHHQEGS
ncbi:MAG: hypothetical protein ACR2ND_05540 [Solirubrobacteraceae bacterium]